MANANTGTPDYQVLAVTPEEAESVVALVDEAFAGTALRTRVYPQEKAHLSSKEEVLAWRVGRLRKTLASKDGLFYKVTPLDDSTRLVGYAAWFTPGHFAHTTLSDGLHAQQAEMSGGEPSLDVVVPEIPEQPPSKEEEKKEGVPACVDVEMYEAILAKCDEQRKKVWGDDNNYYCKLRVCLNALRFAFLTARPQIWPHS